MRYPRQRQTAEIEAEIARARREMDTTLGAIESKLTTDHLIDQGITYLKQSGGREFVSNLGASVRQNPLSVTLVGVGLAWLMLSGRRAAATETGAPSPAGAAEGAAKGSETDPRVRDRARIAVEATRHQVVRARRGFDSMVNEQPLVLGAVGVALGAAIAAAVPRTRTEDEWLGEASDRFAQHLGQAQVDKMREAVDAAPAAASAPDGEGQQSAAAPQAASPEIR